jgi:NAD/NADP transhydrogenase beta subunit
MDDMLRHLPEFVALLVAIHGVAVVVVNMTPTPKDDEALDSITRLGVKAYRAIEILAGIITPLAKR